jgi:hypothetical protein
MKHYIVHLSAGFAGMDSHDLLSVEDGTSQEKLDEMAWQMAVQHAEMYGIYPADQYSEEDGIDEDSLSYNIEGYVVGEYDPEKHDMYRCGGGSFQDEIDRIKARA